jgi:hypothetical protein
VAPADAAHAAVPRPSLGTWSHAPDRTRRPPRDLRDRDPVRPLVTHYDDATGERVELSATTLENWVSKTANLLQDELGRTAGAG